ncbi:MAG: HEAT repeat domain-containing protein [Planctomycetaceae bacterium]|nr:HEAT repeat domain-containing protein [Planctomycetaceae bacterium]
MSVPGLAGAVARLIGETPAPNCLGIPDLISLLQNPKAAVPRRRWAARALGVNHCHDDKAVGALIERLKDECEVRAVRRHCAVVLGKSAGDAALAALRNQIGKSKTHRIVREACAGALAGAQDGNTLLGLLCDNQEDAFVREACAHALRRLAGEPLVLQALEERLCDSKEITEIRKICALTLAEAGSDGAYRVLHAVLDNKLNKGEVRGAAIKGLGKIGSPDASSAIFHFLEGNFAEKGLGRACMKAVTVLCGVPCHQGLSELLANILCNPGATNELRTTCAKGLAKVANRDSCSKIQGFLRDNHTKGNLSEACVVIVRVLCGITRDDHESRKKLSELLSEILCSRKKVPIEVRTQCAEGLGQISGEYCRGALAKASEAISGDRIIVDACCRAMRAIDGNDGPYQDCVDSGEPDTRLPEATAGNRDDDATVVRQIVVFLRSQFRRETECRIAGGLRRLLHQNGYADWQIDTWLWGGTVAVQDADAGGGGETPASGELIWPELQKLAYVCYGHLSEETCDCPESHIYSKNVDYFKKCRRCAKMHALSRLPESHLKDKPELFIWRSVLGGSDAVTQPRAFADTILFPILETPDDRRLEWVWQSGDDETDDGDGQVIIRVSDRWVDSLVVSFDTDSDAGRSQTQCKLCLICDECKTFVGGHRNHDRCREEKHLWKPRMIELSERELDGDIDARVGDVPVSACKHPHFWHPEVVKCPKCGDPRRRGEKYKSLRVYVPQDDALLPD